MIEVAAPGGGGCWIHWRHVSGPAAILSDGPFETEAEGLADACRQLGGTDPRAVPRPG